MDFLIYLAGLMISTAVFWFLLLLTDAWRLRRLRKKYDESKDFSKKGEQARLDGGIRNRTRYNDGGSDRERESTETGVRGFEITDFAPARQDKPTGQRILPPTAPKPSRENSHSFRVSNRYKY